MSASFRSKYKPVRLMLSETAMELLAKDIETGSIRMKERSLSDPASDILELQPSVSLFLYIEHQGSTIILCIVTAAVTIDLNFSTVQYSRDTNNNSNR